VLGSSDWQKRYWLEKAARLLRNGHGLSDEDDIDALSNMSPDAVIDKFMADPRFADTVLDFNLHFLGFKLEDVRDGADFDQDIFSCSTSIAIAFDLTGDLYPEPLAPFQAGRKKTFDAISAKLQAVSAYANAHASADGKSICAQLKPALASMRSLFIGKAASKLAPKRLQTNGPVVDTLEDLSQACASRPTRKDLLAQFTRSQSILQNLFSGLLRFESANYHPHTVADLKPLDLKSIGYSRPWPVFGVAAANLDGIANQRVLASLTNAGQIIEIDAGMTSSLSARLKSAEIPDARDSLIQFIRSRYVANSAGVGGLSEGSAQMLAGSIASRICKANSGTSRRSEALARINSLRI
jgi:hypothetical protein